MKDFKFESSVCTTSLNYMNADILYNKKTKEYAVIAENKKGHVKNSAKVFKNKDAMNKWLELFEEGLYSPFTDANYAFRIYDALT